MGDRCNRPYCCVWGTAHNVLTCLHTPRLDTVLVAMVTSVYVGAVQDCPVGDQRHLSAAVHERHGEAARLAAYLHHLHHLWHSWQPQQRHLHPLSCRGEPLYIYIICGIAGSLSSAIFIPYHVEVSHYISTLSVA